MSCETTIDTLLSCNQHTNIQFVLTEFRPTPSRYTKICIVRTKKMTIGQQPTICLQQCFSTISRPHKTYWGKFVRFLLPKYLKSWDMWDWKKVFERDILKGCFNYRKIKNYLFFTQNYFIKALQSYKFFTTLPLEFIRIWIIIAYSNFTKYCYKNIRKQPNTLISTQSMYWKRPRSLKQMVGR